MLVLLSTVLLVLRLADGAVIKSENVTMLPPFLRTCHVGDRDQCLRDSITSVLRKNGLTPLDPLEVPVLELTQGSGNASVHMVFRHVHFTGLSNTVVQFVKANTEERKLEVACKVPHLDVTGVYQAEGAVLSFPISAQGDFHVNTTDVAVVLIVYLTPEHHHLAVEGLDIDFIPSDITYDFGNYLDGDKKLGEAMNQFLNENSHEVFSALKPHVVQMLSHVMVQVSNRVLKHYPSEE